MWRLALPAIAAMVLFGLNAFMDTVFIGQLLDETALSGVALAYPFSGLLMGLGSWAGTGAGNLLSIVIGKNDEEKQRKILGNSILFALIITIIFAVPAYLFAGQLIALMGGTGIIHAYGTEYLQIVLLAAPLAVLGLSLNFVIRAEGKMKEAARIMSYGLGVNLILTPIFIHYLEWGVAGAAWATNIGMLIYCLSGYVYFRRGKASFDAQIHNLRYDKSITNSIIRMGFPGFIMSIMGLVQAIVVFNAITHVGTEEDLAFFAGANRILLFLMTPLFGLMRALQPVIGINFGAEQYGRVKESFILFTKTGFYLVAPFWLGLTLFPEACMQLVLPDIQFLPHDAFNLRIYMLVLPMLPFVFMALTFFPAINQEKYGSIIGMARQVVFYVPVMLILPNLFGVEWVYYGSTVIDVVVTIWMVVVVVKLFRKLSATTTALT